jgi:YegS/Rv2252/BmrU family lipid kinase
MVPKRPKQVAVIARRGKTFGGGRRELRSRLREAGYDAPLWYEIPKSSRAKKALKHAMKHGAELVLLWGGDGLVQHAIDAVVHGKHRVPLAIMPAGTANLLAHNLGVPMDVKGALDAGLGGVRRAIDVGVLNGECFAVMAGTGADALTMHAVSKVAKERVGALAYFRSGIRAIHEPPVPMTIEVDGKRWFRGDASCVLLGNVGTIQGGVQLFPQASPTDGKLELAVVTAGTKVEWARVMARVATGHPGRSPFVKTTRAKRVCVQREAPAPYELDGGDRDPVARLDVHVLARAVAICVPR